LGWNLGGSADILSLGATNASLNRQIDLLIQDLNHQFLTINGSLNQVAPEVEMALWLTGEKATEWAVTKTVSGAWKLGKSGVNLFRAFPESGGVSGGLGSWLRGGAADSGTMYKDYIGLDGGYSPLLVSDSGSLLGSVDNFGSDISGLLALPAPRANPFTLDDVRMLEGRAKWEAGEVYIQELFGVPGQRHYPVPGTGGRLVDAPVNTLNQGVIANEIKTYQYYMRSGGENKVPLDARIHEQLERDLYLRDTVEGYDPRYLFLEAPPSPDLSRILELNRIIHVIYN